MQILLTNDDGYRAEGILALANRLSKVHTVTVVAPTKSRSGASHSMTFYKDVNVRKSNRYDWECYHVDGTPVDCVRFGAEVVLQDRKPDLVISGINDEANLGTDILYSGTVQAAMQAYTIGYRAVAVSTHGKEENQFLKVADYVIQNLDMLYGMSEFGVVNLNYPYLIGEIKGTKLTAAGKNLFSDEFILQKIHGGRYRYRLIGDPIEVTENPDDCDVNLYRQGYATISVLQNTFRENLKQAAEVFQL